MLLTEKASSTEMVLPHFFTIHTRSISINSVSCTFSFLPFVLYSALVSELSQLNFLVISFLPLVSLVFELSQ